MTPAQFATIGEALHGPSWKRPLAIALQINESTIGRYMRAVHPIPAEAVRALRVLLYEHEKRLASLRRTL